MLRCWWFCLRVGSGSNSSSNNCGIMVPLDARPSCPVAVGGRRCRSCRRRRLVPPLLLQCRHCCCRRLVCSRCCSVVHRAGGQGDKTRQRQRRQRQRRRRQRKSKNNQKNSGMSVFAPLFDCSVTLICWPVNAKYLVPCRRGGMQACWHCCGCGRRRFAAAADIHSAGCRRCCGRCSRNADTIWFAARAFDCSLLGAALDAYEFYPPCSVDSSSP